jgi:hypothetical protein
MTEETRDCELEYDSVDEVPAGGGATIYYQMLGWNTGGSYWESWQSTGTPDLTPPVGPCNPIRVTGSWTE